MDELVCNPGHEHLAHEIFTYLNPEDLSNCSAVSNSWNKSVNESKSWWGCKLLHYATQVPFQIEDPESRPNFMEGGPPFLDQFPDYEPVINYIARFESLQNIKLFLAFLKDYKELQRPYEAWGAAYKGDPTETPLHFAVINGRLDIVKILSRTPLVFEMKKQYDDYNPLQAACINGRTEIVKTILQAQKT